MEKNPIMKKKLKLLKRKKIKSTVDGDEKLINLPDHFKDFSHGAFKELLDQRTILINGDIDEDSIERVVVQINKMSVQSPKTPITLLVNSAGGYVYEMHSIVDTMQHTKTPITTVAMGKVMSAAFDIFLAGDYRISGQNAIFMMHGGHDDLGQITMVNQISESEFNAKLIDRHARYYASRTTVTHKEWLELIYSNKDVYFFPEEAKKMGILHDILEPQTSKHTPKFTKRKVKSKTIKKKKKK